MITIENPEQLEGVYNGVNLAAAVIKDAILDGKEIKTSIPALQEVSDAIGKQKLWRENFNKDTADWKAKHAKLFAEHEDLKEKFHMMELTYGKYEEREDEK